MIQKITWSSLKPQLHPLDLLLCSGTGVVSDLIKQSTDSQFSHVALLTPFNDQPPWLVLESVESIGVRAVTLEDGYLNDYMSTGAAYPGQLFIARHQHMLQKKDHFEALYQKAWSLMGKAYNQHDIVSIAKRIVESKFHNIHPAPLQPNHAYICSEYVSACYECLDIHLQNDRLGFIAPADIARDPNITILYEIIQDHTTKGRVEEAFDSIKDALL